MPSVAAPLPIDPALPRIVEQVRRHGSAALLAPPGAGKTTRVPPALLDAGLADDRLIVMLQPRRLAATTAARRMAEERGESVGQTIGYQVRFDRQASKRTRILVVTEGIMLRMLVDDPLLEQVGIVVFDEFHERRLDSDLALAITRRLRNELRDDLKIVVMSATYDPQPIASFLDGEVTSVAGRTFPVDIRYVPRPGRERIDESAAAGVDALWDQTAGDVLVFLPGVGEIRQTARRLADSTAAWGAELHELYADAPAETQQRAIARGARRKIILATNVAETSVTIDGVTGVVDTGWARVPSFDPRIGLNRLELCRISQASTDQRSGRAGRTQPGICVRLWSEAQQRQLAEQLAPEVTRLELSAAALHLLAWGETDLPAFPWFQPPTPHSLERAARLLEDLGATHAGRLTPLGRSMASLPLEPRLARLLLEAQKVGCLPAATIAAALLGERDPFRQSNSPNRPGAIGSRQVLDTDSDLVDRVEAMEAFAEEGQTDSPLGPLDGRSAQAVLRLADQLRRTATNESNATRTPTTPPSDADAAALLRRCLLAAFPDRVAKRREPRGSRAVMVGGRGVQLAESSGVRESDLFICLDTLDTGSADSMVRLASAIEPEWLDPRLIRSTLDVEFDEQRERVRVIQRRRYHDLIMDERHTSDTANADTASVLFAHASRQLVRVLPKDDREFDQFLARVRCLRQWLPQCELPDLDASHLHEVLRALCDGRRGFDELRQAPWLDFTRGLLSYEHTQLLDREAPEQIATPRGHRLRLRYEVGRPPILSARIQELFGMRETPRIAAGRVPVLLELLGPNMRPQQLTDDLPSFWKNTYPVIRKELRRRYPKHDWPENP